MCIDKQTASNGCLYERKEAYWKWQVPQYEKLWHYCRDIGHILRFCASTVRHSRREGKSQGTVCTFSLHQQFLIRTMDTSWHVQKYGYKASWLSHIRSIIDGWMVVHHHHPQPKHDANCIQKCRGFSLKWTIFHSGSLEWKSPVFPLPSLDTLAKSPHRNSQKQKKIFQIGAVKEIRIFHFWKIRNFSPARLPSYYVLLNAEAFLIA